MRAFILRRIGRGTLNGRERESFLSDPAEHLVGPDHVSHGKSAAEIDPQTSRINVITARGRAHGTTTTGGTIPIQETFFRPEFPEKDSVDVNTRFALGELRALERDSHGRFSFKFGVDQILWHLGY
jgi:hypothetical protein